jgi:hypothetical protein
MDKLIIKTNGKNILIEQGHRITTSIYNTFKEDQIIPPGYYYITRMKMHYYNF